MKNAQEEYDLSVEVDHPLMNNQAASIPSHTIVPHVMTAEPVAIALKKQKKKVTSLGSPSTFDDDSKHDELVSKPKKASLTLSGTKQSTKKVGQL